jgi:hypothetical protein
MNALGDWGPITPDSALPGYTGPSSDTIVDQNDPTKYFTLDYYSNQIAQFQASLIQLDQTAQILGNLLAGGTLNATDAASVQAWLDDYNGNKTQVQAIAAAVNGIVNTANAFGVGLPNVTLPQTLSQWQPLAIVGVAAAVAATASIIAWASQKIVTAQSITAQLASLPADQRAAALQQITAANPTTLSSISNIVKWVAIGAVIFFGYKAWTEYRGGRSLMHSITGGGAEAEA